MDWRDLLAALVLIALASTAYLWYIRENRRWVQVHAAPGHRQDSAVILHNALRDSGVRSQLQIIGTGVGRPIAGQNICVNVHVDDLLRARRILAELQQRGFVRQ